MPTEGNRGGTNGINSLKTNSGDFKKAVTGLPNYMFCKYLG